MGVSRVSRFPHRLAVSRPARHALALADPSRLHRLLCAATFLGLRERLQTRFARQNGHSAIDRRRRHDLDRRSRPGIRPQLRCLRVFDLCRRIPRHGWSPASRLGTRGGSYASDRGLVSHFATTVPRPLVCVRPRVGIHTDHRRHADFPNRAGAQRCPAASCPRGGRAVGGDRRTRAHRPRSARSARPHAFDDHVEERTRTQADQDRSGARGERDGRGGDHFPGHAEPGERGRARLSGQRHGRRNRERQTGLEVGQRRFRHARRCRGPTAAARDCARARAPRGRDEYRPALGGNARPGRTQTRSPPYHLHTD